MHRCTVRFFDGCSVPESLRCSTWRFGTHILRLRRGHALKVEVRSLPDKCTSHGGWQALSVLSWPEVIRILGNSWESICTCEVKNCWTMGKGPRCRLLATSIWKQCAALGVCNSWLCRRFVQSLPIYPNTTNRNLQHLLCCILLVWTWPLVAMNQCVSNCNERQTDFRNWSQSLLVDTHKFVRVCSGS